MARFDYIITIHNKEDLIERVLFSLLAVMKNDSHIYAVLDGCTDKTEQIVDDFCNNYRNVPLTKVYADDVHEIKSINAGLRALPKADEGFVICLQDDVLMADLLFEEKVQALYKKFGKKLGYVSFRLAANLISWKEVLAMKEVDLIENSYSSHGLDVIKAEDGEIAFRDAAIKSPVCIPRYLLNDIGLLDEDLAPYSWDDHEYSIRSLEAGYKNALFPIKFVSDLDWGGTRRKAHPTMGKYHVRNTRIIHDKHEKFFAADRKRNQDSQKLDLVKNQTEPFEGIVGESTSGKMAALGRKLSGKSVKR